MTDKLESENRKPKTDNRSSLDCTSIFPYTQYMATLTYVTTKTKLTIKWLSISLIFLSILLVFMRIGFAVKERLFPAAPPPPAVTFGKLHPLSFPNSATDQKLTYSIDTISGFLPNMPPQVKVYGIIKAKPQFLALDLARQKVASAGFRSSETRLSETWYRWTDQGYPSREITFNLFSNDFTVSSPFLSDPIAYLFANSFSNQNAAINSAQALLSAVASFPDDLDLKLTKTLYYSITEDGRLNPEANINSAQAIRVDFFQKNVDNLPIYYPNSTTSTINVLVANLQNQPFVIGANYNHQPISSAAHTYPIKTAVDAFVELRDQKAYIVSYFGESLNISIRNVTLGYYIGNEKQDFLMPIIVFEGDEGFVAYVSAVTDEWISN